MRFNQKSVHKPLHIRTICDAFSIAAGLGATRVGPHLTSSTVPAEPVRRQAEFAPPPGEWRAATRPCGSASRTRGISNFRDAKAAQETVGFGKSKVDELGKKKIPLGGFVRGRGIGPGPKPKYKAVYRKGISSAN